MSKKMLVLALSLMATVLLAAGSSFGQACSSGIAVQYVGIGSSAQFNTLAFGAFDTIGGAPNVWTSSTAEVVDTRVLVGGSNPVDKGLKVWVIYDNNTTCNVYVGFQADSVQGVKDFYCYGKLAAPRVGVVADCFGFHDSTQTPSWELANCANVVPGLPCSPAGALPAAISSFLVTQPIPSCTGTCSNHTQALPQPYCGNQSLDSAGTVGTMTEYCYFNAAHTDIRQEDALYATTRALSSYNTTNSMYGLGYNNAACGSTGTGAKVIGCPINDSFAPTLAKQAVFFPLNFALKGVDPYTAAANVPTGTTVTLGASPVVVFVSNADSTNSYGFGIGQPNNYLHKDVLHKVLAQIFEGVDSCTGDLLPSSLGGGSFGDSVPGAGQPIQVVVREPLSGTYNTFEFTGVRTFSGSGLNAVAPTGVMIGLNKITTATTGAGPSWVSDQESSQELDVRNNFGQAGPAFGWTAGVNSPHCTPFPDGTQNCGDPLFYQTGSVDSTNACGTGIKVRAIGTGEEVKATLGITPSPAPSAWTVTDGIGYAFWGYSNFAPACVGPATASTGDVTCSQYLGHYLTVDAIDPIFTTEGGGFPLTVAAPAVENPNGSNNFPQCAAIQKTGSFPCQQIPFTHIYDGKYPLWSLLRIVTFANITTKTATMGTVTTPLAVLNVVANAQLEGAPGSAKQLSDFVPFLSGLTFGNNASCPGGIGGAKCWIGNLNLGVFRVHSEISAVPPDNGHKGCAPFTPGALGDGTFTNVALQGGTAGHSTCLVDAGSDMGGTVKTVQADVDYFLDLGGAAPWGAAPKYPLEIYNLHQ